MEIKPGQSPRLQGNRDPESHGGALRLAFSEKYDDIQAERYFRKHGETLARRLSHWRETVMLRKALRAAGDPATVLDLPSGTGRFWPLLAERPARRIIAADYSFDMVSLGLARHPAWVIERVQPLRCSAFAIPLRDNAVECVFCIRFLHHVGRSADRLAALRELARVARYAVCLTLWVDGNYKARRRRRLEARRKDKRYQNRFVLPRVRIEEEFRTAGLEPVAKIDFFRFYSMWRAYVLRK